jgi:hypothetical protein
MRETANRLSGSFNSFGDHRLIHTPPFLCSLVLCWTQKEEEEDNALNILSGYLVAAGARLTAATAEPGPPIKGLATSAKRGENVRDHVAFFFLSFFYFAFLPLSNTRH